MYRIVFDTQRAAWIIQLQTIPLWWRTIMLPKGGEPRAFHNHAEAVKYVEDVGLDKVYKNWADRPSVSADGYYQPQHRDYGYQVTTPPKIV
jgi:hypothetical protein